MSTALNTTEMTTLELRKFGFIMGIMFVLIFGLLIPWLITDKTSENWPVWPFIVMAFFWCVALILPKALAPINKLWMRVGNVLGWINSRIILGVMFYLLIFPIGLLLKLFGKDSMNRKLESNSTSYRKIVKMRNKNHLERPF